MDFIYLSLKAAWAILEDASPFLLAGFFLAGLVKVFLPMDLVKRKLGSNGFRAVFNASLLGIPLPLCSCSVIPTAVSLRANGASKGATSAFLISTPESGVDSIAITYALLDPIMTVFRPVAAFMTSLLAGFGENLLGDKSENGPVAETAQVIREEHCDGDCEMTCQEAGHDAEPRSGRLPQAIRFAFVDLIDDLAGWLVTGILAAGVAQALIPEGFFEQFAGDGFGAMIVMLLAGIPMYICATASTPLAAALMAKGLPPGAALVFLLSGPATNIGTLAIIRKFMGGRSLAIYLSAIVLGSLSAGLGLNWIYAAMEVDPSVTIGKAGELFPHLLQTASAVVFSALALRSLASGVWSGLFSYPESKAA